MTKAAYALILESYCNNHNWILNYAEKLTDAQLSWKAGPGTLSIAFFLWHLGRWADHLQAALPGMTPELTRRLPPGIQVWETGDYARTWGFDSGSTGYAETGMYMDEATAAQLVFPSKDVLLDYVRRAFAAAEQAMKAIDEEQFLAVEQPQTITEGIWEPDGTVGSAIISHLIHDDRHLGMMECLVGLQKGSGSASV